MPEMRAEQLKENLYALLALGNETASRILADLPPQHLRRIEQASPSDWLPFEIDLVLVRTIHRVAGEAGARVWARAALRRTLDGSLLKPLLDTAVRLFGLSPAGLFRMAPQGWRTAFRDAGDLTVGEAGPSSLVVDLVGLPEEMRDESFVLAIGGSLEALFDASQVSGEVRPGAPPPGAGARYLATWTPR